MQYVQTCEEQHKRNKKVWGIKHGLVQHSLAAGSATREA